MKCCRQHVFPVLRPYLTFDILGLSLKFLRGSMLKKKYTLPNGVRVIEEKIPYVRSVAIGIWVKTGSRFESPDTNGMAHFIEHMAFKGTKNRSARDIAETFDAIGGHVNAFTSKEYTCFYARVLDEHVDVALDVLHDMFFHSTFDEGEMEKEKQVVIEEIRMVEDTPDDWIHDLASKASIPRHPLGYPILGPIENVSQFKSEDLKEYVKTHYTPDRTVITVAGNIPDTWRDEVTRWFGQFQRERGGGQSVPSSPQFYPGIEQRVKPTEQAHFCLSLPGLAIHDPHIYDLTLLNSIVGGSMSSRLFQDIREEHGLAYSVYSYHLAYEDFGTFGIYAGTGLNQTNRVYELILNILRDVRENGVTKKELNKAKEQLKGSFTLSMESTTNRMSRLGKNELMLGKHPSLDEVVEKIDSIQLDDVVQLAERLFSGPLSFALISPHDDVPEAFRSDPNV